MPAHPWMPLHIGAYLADTAHLDATESGAYLHLIFHYWQHGGLPDDERELARIAKISRHRWTKICHVLKKFFHDGWHHKRIDQELKRADEISEKRRLAAEAKHEKFRANAEQKHTHLHKQETKKERTDKTLEAERDGENVSRETSPPAPVESPSGRPKQYAFCGDVIRLTQVHFDQWTRAYPQLSLLAELTARDVWLASARAKDSDRENWFISTSKYLANRNMEAKAKANPPQQKTRYPDPHDWRNAIA